MKKNNFRRCLITKKVFHKNELYRFVVKDNKMILDKNNSLPGRGYYVAKNHDFNVIESFIAKRFKMNVEK